MGRNENIQLNHVWTGYENLKDPTNMPTTALAPGSLNVYINNSEKVAVRNGSTYLGAEGTQTNGIIGSYYQFTNPIGINIPVRFFKNDNNPGYDQMDMWFQGAWRPVTASSASELPNAPHRYYFAEWYNKGTVSAVENQSYLIITAGTGYSNAWTGAVGRVQSITPTTITITGGTYASQGFSLFPVNNQVMINGDLYDVTSNFNTNTITVTQNPTGLVFPGDLIVQAVWQYQPTPSGQFNYDFCAGLYNQVYYGDFDKRKVFISNNENQDASIDSAPIFSNMDLTLYGLNDASFSLNPTYTGTANAEYKVVIDSIPTQTSSFTGSGLNDGLFDYTTNPYTGSGTNTYKIVVVADQSFTFAGVPAPIPTPGELLTGNISGAQGYVVTLDSGGQDPVLRMVPGTGDFQVGETVTGSISGVIPQVIFTVTIGDWCQYYKDSVLTQPGLPYALPPGFYYFQILEPPVYPPFSYFDLNDGIMFAFETYSGHTIGDFWELTMTGGQEDTFSWYLNGSRQGDLIPCSTSATALSNGVEVTFGAVIGHAKGDTWTIQAYRKIDVAWADFSYSQPKRLPGEGFEITLDSVFLTMTPQEKEMYVFARGGQAYTVQPTLSSDLQSENITVTRLKSDPQGIPLEPYLIGYFRNMLSMVAKDKTFSVLGRQALYELPQAEILSDRVKYDFQPADFTDGDILYFKRTLYITLPKENLVFVYDDNSKYWNPPYRFAKRVGLLSVINDEVIGHSYETNESYRINASEAYEDLKTVSSPGYAISSAIVMPYNNYGERFKIKKANVVGFEGYMTGNAQINYRVNFDLGGCQGHYSDVVNPIFCYPGDTASLGKSSLGRHGLGTDPVHIAPKFRDRKEFSGKTFYEANIELTCDSIYQDWSFIGIGLDASDGNYNNKEITSNHLSS